jgi:hypothetical protein
MRKNVFLACFSACFRVILLGFPKSRACIPRVHILKSTECTSVFTGFPAREDSVSAFQSHAVIEDPETHNGNCISQRVLCSYTNYVIMLFVKICGGV